MTTEMTIFVFLFLGIAIAAVFAVKMLFELDKENEELQELLVQQERIIGELECLVESLGEEKAKKDSLISILRVELEDKEAKKK